MAGDGRTQRAVIVDSYDASEGLKKKKRRVLILKILFSIFKHLAEVQCLQLACT